MVDLEPILNNLIIGAGITAFVGSAYLLYTSVKSEKPYNYPSLRKYFLDDESIDSKI